MTDTTQGKKTLAQFCGRYEGDKFILHGYEAKIEPDWGRFPFNTDWNWLHEAWEKFRDLTVPNYWKAHFENVVLDSVGDSILYNPISRAFTALVEAVEWWNRINEKEVKDGTATK